MNLACTNFLSDLMRIIAERTLEGGYGMRRFGANGALVAISATGCTPIPP